MMLFATLAMIVSAQTDDKGYKEGAWVLKGVTGVNMSQTAMTNWSAAYSRPPSTLPAEH